MIFYNRLEHETETARRAFVEIPVIARALTDGVSADLYAAYLGQAYHHVRHTCPLLRFALAQCPPDDKYLADALLEYIEEEEGHEVWILNDIRAIAGQETVDQVVAYEGDPPVRALVAYMYDAIARRGPMAMLGMVYVLEGISALLAEQAAAAIARQFGERPTEGFSYMTSHGALDREHVAFFRDLVNGIGDRVAEDLIIDTANMVFYLWGRMFDELDRQHARADHAA